MRVSGQCDLDNWTVENKRLEKELETGEFAGMNWRRLIG